MEKKRNSSECSNGSPAQPGGTGGGQVSHAPVSIILGVHFQRKAKMPYAATLLPEGAYVFKKALSPAITPTPNYQKELKKKLLKCPLKLRPLAVFPRVPLSRSGI